MQLVRVFLEPSRTDPISVTPKKTFRKTGLRLWNCKEKLVVERGPSRLKLF